MTDMDSTADNGADFCDVHRHWYASNIGCEDCNKTARMTDKPGDYEAQAQLDSTAGGERGEDLPTADDVRGILAGYGDDKEAVRIASALERIAGDTKRIADALEAQYLLAKEKTIWETGLSFDLDATRQKEGKD